MDYIHIVCYRPGRVGFEVGDVIAIPANVDAFDRTYFRMADPNELEDIRKAKEVANLKEVARLEKQVAEAEAKAHPSDPSEAPEADKADGE